MKIRQIKNEVYGETLNVEIVSIHWVESSGDSHIADLVLQDETGLVSARAIVNPLLNPLDLIVGDRATLQVDIEHNDKRELIPFVTKVVAKQNARHTNLSGSGLYISHISHLRLNFSGAFIHATIDSVDRTIKSETEHEIKYVVTSGTNRLAIRTITNPLTNPVILFRGDEAILRIHCEAVGRNDVAYVLDNVVMWTTPSAQGGDFKFLDSTQPLKYIEDAIESIGDKYLQTITRFIYFNVKADIPSGFGSAKNHHMYKGGLLVHTARVLELAMFLAKTRPFLDRDLLISSAILHDLGKLTEIKEGQNGEAVRTVEGRLQGHLMHIVEMVHDAVKSLRFNKDTPVILHLLHVLSSHHGARSHGSLVEPQLVESVAVSLSDSVDARLDQAESLINATSEGGWSEKGAYFPSPFYKPKATIN